MQFPGTHCLFPTQMAVFQAFCPVSSPLLTPPKATHVNLPAALYLLFASLQHNLWTAPLAFVWLLTCSWVSPPAFHVPWNTTSSPWFYSRKNSSFMTSLKRHSFRMLCCGLIPITLLWVPCSLHLPFTVLFLLYLVIDSVTDDFLSLSKAMLTCPLQATISFHPHPWKSSFINLLESLWLFSKPCFMLQQNDAFQKMVWWLFCYSQQRDKGPHISEKTL